MKKASKKETRVPDTREWAARWLADPEGSTVLRAFEDETGLTGKRARVELHGIAKLTTGSDRSSWTLCVLEGCRLGRVGVRDGRFVLREATRPSRLVIAPGLFDWLEAHANAIQYWLDRCGVIEPDAGPLFGGRVLTCKSALRRLREVAARQDKSVTLPEALAWAIGKQLIVAKEAGRR